MHSSRTARETWPRLHEAAFMGYPPGVKGWHCRDVVTGAFFNSRDVIFDENFTHRPFPDSDDEDEDPAVPSTPAPIASHPPVPAPPHLDIIRCSGRIPAPTAKGALFQVKMTAGQAATHPSMRPPHSTHSGCSSTILFIR
ncbi:hypothetical protein P692DRAFT_20737011 [Suillus brevipes Sb2]|nr:hypothetical protein P692DRAFT_20737011 [Suillus brevipes Sb2]